MRLVTKIHCKKCGHEAKRNEEKSNSNWSVFEMKCPKCAEQMTMELLPESPHGEGK